MKRIALTIMIISGLVAAPLTAGASTHRAMWVWDGPVAGVIDFAASKNVTDLYLSAPPGFSSDSRYGAFIADAHAVGMAVHAVAGDAGWARDRAAWVGWTEEVVAHGGFDGIVADVEPYLLADWSTRRQSRVIADYLKSLDAAESAAGSMPMMVAVPFWWDLPEYENRKGTLVERVLDIADGVVVMAYRDVAAGPDGIIAHSQFEIAAAAERGKLAIVGVETGAAELDKVSFLEEGEAYMNGELNTVESTLGGAAGYGGIAIHHYGSYSSLGS